MSHLLAPVSVAEWFNKGRAIRYRVYVIMHAKDLQLYFVKVGHCVLLAVFCLFRYGLHVLNRDVNMIQTRTKLTYRCISANVWYVMIVEVVNMLMCSYSYLYINMLVILSTCRYKNAIL